MQTSIFLKHLSKNLAPAQLAVVRRKCTDYDDTIQYIKRIGEDILQFDTKCSDPFDHASRECSLEDLHRNNKMARLKLQKIEGVLSVVARPSYEGCCNACEGKLLLFRIIKYNSVICTACAQLAESTTN